MTRDELKVCWAQEIPSDAPVRERRTDLTFAGFYITYYEACTRYWHSERTRAQNNTYLNELILPNLDGHDLKSIDEYTMADFDRAIAKITSAGQLRAKQNGVKEPYADSTVQRFRNIIARIIQAAAKYGFCDNILEDSCYILTPAEVSQVKSQVLFVQKSIPLSAEISTIEFLLHDHTADGKIIGLLLVMACGLRLNESTAVNFGNIVELKYHPGEYKLMVFESTEINSTEVKTSGKTPNADRAVPLYDRVAQFLLKRREYVAAELKKRGLDIDVDTLPIACNGWEYRERCTTKQISDKAREIFLQHKVEPAVFQYADLTLREAERRDIREKNPTGYLGRHVFATQLSLLDLTESEMQAIIGHDIEDSNVRRSDFNSDERLHEIKKKMDRMPIYRLGSDSIKVSDYDGCISGTGPLTLQVDQPLRHLHVSVETEETFDSLSIECQAGDDGVLIVGQKAPRFRRGIDVMEKYGEVYKMIKGNTPW